MKRKKILRGGREIQKEGEGKGEGGYFVGRERRVKGGGVFNNEINF